MEETKKKFDRYEYQLGYNKSFRKENYDHIGFNVPKGQREVIKARAESLGMSVNAYMVHLIKKDMEENGTENEAK